MDGYTGNEYTKYLDEKTIISSSSLHQHLQ